MGSRGRVLDRASIGREFIITGTVGALSVDAVTSILGDSRVLGTLLPLQLEAMFDNVETFGYRDGQTRYPGSVTIKLVNGREVNLRHRASRINEFNLLPSGCRGKGRRGTADDVLEHLEGMNGFILADASLWPCVNWTLLSRPMWHDRNCPTVWRL